MRNAKGIANTRPNTPRYKVVRVGDTLDVITPFDWSDEVSQSSCISRHPQD